MDRGLVCGLLSSHENAKGAPVRVQPERLPFDYRLRLSSSISASARIRNPAAITFRVTGERTTALMN